MAKIVEAKRWQWFDSLRARQGLVPLIICIVSRAFFCLSAWCQIALEINNLAKNGYTL